ncbi:MAG: 3-oxoacyl-ACP reductase FabG [Clostridia bacterium]|nr:3-oxoacyl-ACP reductase FabG [Clostridia bacterium]
MKTILITGGAKGIGKAIAYEFAKKGYNVVITYKTSEEEATRIKEELTNYGKTVEIYKADVSKKDDVKKLVEFTLNKFGKIDVLVNNAGISEIIPFAEMEEENWDNMINNNLKSVYLMTKEVIESMIHNKYGHIINISSVWGISGASCEVHYSAAKAGIIGFTKALAQEMGPSNIKVNSIAPGIINTDMNKELSKEEIEEIQEDIPIGEIGKVEDVAKTAVFLAESDYITGEVIRVDGGWKI